MAYALKQIDLAKHKFDPAKHPRIPGGPGGGEFRSLKSSFSLKSSSGGAHLRMSSEDVTSRFTDDSFDIETHSRSIDVALSRAETAKPGTTEHDHAWLEVAAHAEKIAAAARKAAEANEAERRKAREAGAANAVDRTIYKVKDAAGRSEKVTKAKDYIKDTGFDAARARVQEAAVNIGARIAGASAGVLGVGEAEHFSEAFQKLTENPALEAGISAAAALLLSALVARIRKALKAHHDKKIAAARAAKEATA